jgi:hypothetical protein
VEELRSIDIDGLTPLEALNKLAELQRRARERPSDAPAEPTATEEE